jgi:hypothetical protein
MISRRIKMGKIFPKVANHFSFSFPDLLLQERGKKDGLRMMKDALKGRPTEISAKFLYWHLLCFQKLLISLYDLYILKIDRGEQKGFPIDH